MKWSNPIIPNRADPYVYLHTDGFYYFTGTVPEYDRIELRRARTLEALASTQVKTIWHEHKAGEMCQHVWAPEIHYYENKWIIYFAAAHQEDEWRIRMYVLENSHEDPFQGVWEERGQVKTQWESFSLDATTFKYNQKSYLVWAQSDPKIEGNSNIYMDELINPWTVAGKQVMLTTPEYDWERIGYKVNEGPAVLQTEEKIYISFSASATDANYCLGLLTFDKGLHQDVMDVKNWKKSEKPVFKSSDDNLVFGPGHNSFTTSPDGAKHIMIYHARNYKEIVGEALNDPNRHMRAQLVFIDDAGELIFEEPVKDGPYDCEEVNA